MPQSYDPSNVEITPVCMAQSYGPSNVRDLGTPQLDDIKLQKWIFQEPDRKHSAKLNEDFSSRKPQLSTKSLNTMEDFQRECFIKLEYDSVNL